MVLKEEEYEKIGKAVIDECLRRAGERSITVTLRSVQFGGKMYIRIENIVEPISIWDYSDLMAIIKANTQQRARKRETAGHVETISIKIPPKMEERGSLNAVKI
jgi:hypothetical protein